MHSFRLFINCAINCSVLVLLYFKIGKLILQGNYELAVKYLLFKTNEYEMPLVAELKNQAEEIYPEFKQIETIFEKLPYSFLYELRVVNYLKNRPKDFTGALAVMGLLLIVQTVLAQILVNNV